MSITTLLPKPRCRGAFTAGLSRFAPRHAEALRVVFAGIQPPADRNPSLR
jgi:hypothetical protein